MGGTRTLLAAILLGAATRPAAGADTGSGPPPRELRARLTPRTLSINGDLTDWEGVAVVSFAGRAERRGRNQCAARVAWDQRKLYLAFEVRDSALHASRVEDSATVYGDDAVEVFLDRGYDHGDVMEEDDYHVLLSIGGSVAVARGSDTLRVKEEWRVPQQFLAASDVLRFVRLRGTPNDAAADDGYTVELALFWDDIGGLPREGEVIGMDLCIDDRDAPQPAGAQEAPEDPEAYEPFSLGGATDFGYPRDWLPVTFEGHVPVMVRLSSWVTPARAAAAMALPLGFLWLAAHRQRSRARATLRGLREELARLRQVPPASPTGPVALQPAAGPPPVSTTAPPEGSGPEPVALPAPFLAPSPPPPPVPGDAPARPVALPSLDTPPLEPTAADRIEQYLSANHAEALDMEGVARALGMSPKTMERILKRERHTTYGALLTSVRMGRARELLLRTERSITEIAFDVGYTDSSYFTRVFRRQHGMTPRDLRRAWDAARAEARSA